MLSSFIKPVDVTILSLLKAWDVVKLVVLGFCLLFLFGSWLFLFSLEQNKNVPV